MTSGDRSPPLRVDHHTANGEVVVVAAGEMDVATVALFDDTIAALRPLRGPLGLDLTGIEFIDSSGLKALLEARQAAVDDVGVPPRIVAASPAVSTLLDVCGMADVFTGPADPPT